MISNTEIDTAALVTRHAVTWATHRPDRSKLRGDFRGCTVHAFVDEFQ